MIATIVISPPRYLTAVVACLTLAYAVYPDLAFNEKRGHLIRREELDVSGQAEILQDPASLLDIESSHRFANYLSSSNGSSGNASKAMNASEDEAYNASSTACNDTSKNVSSNVSPASKCECIDPELDHYPIIGGREVTEGYAKHLGSECKAWDHEVYPGKCQGTKQESFCGQKWCFVDPCQCNIDSIPVASLYFPDRKLYYSYEACGDEDVFTKKHNPFACTNYQEQNPCDSLRECKWIGTLPTSGRCVATPEKTCLNLGRPTTAAVTTNDAPAAKDTNVTNATTSSRSRDSAKKPARLNLSASAEPAASADTTSIPIVICLYATIPLQIIIIAIVYSRVKQKSTQKDNDTDESNKTKIEFKMTIGGIDPSGLSSDQDLLNEAEATITQYVVELAGNAISASDVDASFEFDYSVNVLVTVEASPPSDETVVAALRDAIAGPFGDTMATRLRSAPGFGDVIQGEIYVSCSDVEMEGRP